MIYAKLTEGVIHFAPREIEIGGEIIKFPTDEQLKSAGYLPVEFTSSPIAPESYEYMEGWEETGEAIVQTWTLVELPDELDDSELVNILLGEGLEI